MHARLGLARSRKEPCNVYVDDERNGRKERKREPMNDKMKGEDSEEDAPSVPNRGLFWPENSRIMSISAFPGPEPYLLITYFSRQHPQALPPTSATSRDHLQRE